MKVFSLKAATTAALYLSELRALANGTNTVEISARISTGEVIVAYSGKLIS